MTTLQTDLIQIFNSLVEFSNDTSKSKFPIPIKVHYDSISKALVFEQKGKTVYIQVINNYCLDLNKLIKPTYLTPNGYEYLMSTLQDVILSGKLLEDRTCISPEKYGFSIYCMDKNSPEKGPNIIGEVIFISGISRFFKYRIKKKYKL